MLRQRLVRPYEQVKHVLNFLWLLLKVVWPNFQVLQIYKKRKVKEMEPFDAISESS